MSSRQRLLPAAHEISRSRNKFLISNLELEESFQLLTTEQLFASCQRIPSKLKAKPTSSVDGAKRPPKPNLPVQFVKDVLHVETSDSGRSTAHSASGLQSAAASASASASATDWSPERSPTRRVTQASPPKRSPDKPLIDLDSSPTSPNGPTRSHSEPDLAALIFNALPAPPAAPSVATALLANSKLSAPGAPSTAASAAAYTAASTANKFPVQFESASPARHVPPAPVPWRHTVNFGNESTIGNSNISQPTQPPPSSQRPFSALPPPPQNQTRKVASVVNPFGSAVMPKATTTLGSSAATVASAATAGGLPTYQLARSPATRGSTTTLMSTISEDSRVSLALDTRSERFDPRFPTMAPGSDLSSNDGSYANLNAFTSTYSNAGFLSGSSADLPPLARMSSSFIDTPIRSPPLQPQQQPPPYPSSAPLQPTPAVASLKLGSFGGGILEPTPATRSVSSSASSTLLGFGAQTSSLGPNPRLPVATSNPVAPQPQNPDLKQKSDKAFDWLKDPVNGLLLDLKKPATAPLASTPSAADPFTLPNERSLTPWLSSSAVSEPFVSSVSALKLDTQHTRVVPSGSGEYAIDPPSVLTGSPNHPLISPVMKQGKQLSDTHYWLFPQATTGTTGTAQARVPTSSPPSARPSEQLRSNGTSSPVNSSSSSSRPRSPLSATAFGPLPASLGASPMGSTPEQRVRWVTSKVHGVTNEESQTALLAEGWDCEKAVRYLQVEQLFRLGLTTKEQCRKLLERLNWSLETASQVLIDEMRDRERRQQHRASAATSASLTAADFDAVFGASATHR